MIGFSIGQIARLTDGTLDQVADPSRMVTGPVVIDSRQVSPGALFAAGSAGKATTKDLVAQLTSAPGPTVSPQNSFNNEIGHPLTVLRADEDTRYLIADMSARGLGHITALCQISPPRLGPEALAAALAAVRVMASGRRAYAVLGRMAGLGERSREFHEQAGVIAAKTGLTGIIAVGDEAAPILTGAKSEPGFAGELVAVPDDASAVAAITQRLRPGDVVLVKASRAAALQTVALALTAQEATTS